MSVALLSATEKRPLQGVVHLPPVRKSSKPYQA